MATGKKETGLAKRASVELAVMDPDQQLDLTAIAEELDEDAVSLGMALFSRVKIPSGGGIAFEIENPDAPDDPDVEKIIEGVVVTTHKVNAYWPTGLDDGEGSTPPACSSVDGKVGHGKRFDEDDELTDHLCSECPLNQFGSAEAGGKACKNRRHLYVLRPGDILPLLIVLPATSLKPWLNYAGKAIVTRGRRTFGVVTRIGLEKAKNAGGIEYAKATFAFAGELEPVQTAFLDEYGRQMKAVVTAYTPAFIAATVGAEAGVGDDMPF